MKTRRTSARGGAGAAGHVLRTTLFVAAVAGLMIFHVWSRTRVLASGYEFGELQRAHAQLTSDHDRLRLEVESLRAPSTLEKLARTKLDMAPPAPGTVRVAEPAVATADAHAVAEIPHDKIAARAAEIWERNGHPHGQDVQNWMEAEAVLRAEFAATPDPDPLPRKSR